MDHSEHASIEQEKNKVISLNEVQDIISLGALLRPTLHKSIQKCTTTELDQLKKILIESENILSNETYDLREKVNRCGEIFSKTYRFGPIWRFIFGRVEEIYRHREDPTKNDLSTISLIIGMIFQEINLKNKKAV